MSSNRYCRMRRQAVGAAQNTRDGGLRAKTNLLNTRTTNFLELVGNGKIYRVPSYQRDYSWEEEQWEDLWNDIVELRQNVENRHYMGALVVEGKSDREFLVIDGQQRIATLSLLALAAIGHLNRRQFSLLPGPLHPIGDHLGDLVPRRLRRSKTAESHTLHNTLRIYIVIVACGKARAIRICYSLMPHLCTSPH